MWRLITTTAVAAITMFGADMIWLGLVARDLYDRCLGPLKRSDIYWPAAALFYSMYIGTIVWIAVYRSASAKAALLRGAALGAFAYSTYELTNWAVIAGWPAVLVPLDVAWGTVLTAGTAYVAKLAQTVRPRISGAA